MTKSKKCVMNRYTNRCRNARKSPAKRSKYKPKRTYYRRPPCDNPEKVRDPVTKRCRYRKTRYLPKRSRMVKPRVRHSPNSYYARRYPREAARINRSYRRRPNVQSRTGYTAQKPRYMQSRSLYDTRAMTRAAIDARMRGKLRNLNNSGAVARARQKGYDDRARAKAQLQKAARKKSPKPNNSSVDGREGRKADHARAMARASQLRAQSEKLQSLNRSSVGGGIGKMKRL